MSNIWVIARRDLKAYFSSPVGYAVIALFMAIMGWMFFSILSYFNAQSAQFMQFNAGKAPSITEGIVRPLYQNMNVIFLLLVPLITMRLFAEERKLHTIELLLTAPVTLTEVILGKFLSSFLLVLIMLAITLVYPITLFIAGNPELGPIVTSYLGVLLLASSYLSIGLLFSAMTENQIVAGMLTFATSLFFWLVSWATETAGPFWGEVLRQLSLINHYFNFQQGQLNSADVIYYLSFTFFGLFLTHRVLDSYRWR